MATIEEFYDAVKNGNLPSVQSLLHAQPGFALQRHEGATALHFAAIHNNRAIVDLLLAEGANPEAEDDEFESTPINWANEAGHTDMVQYLYERGTRVGFYLAAAFGLTDRLRALIDQNISQINMMRGYGTPIHFAALWGHPVIVQILLNHGADPQIRNMNGKTALEIAQDQVATNGDATPLVNAGRRKELIENCRQIVRILEVWSSNRN